MRLQESWTAFEDDILCRHGPAEAARRLNRSPSSTLSRMHQLNHSEKTAPVELPIPAPVARRPDVRPAREIERVRERYDGVTERLESLLSCLEILVAANAKGAIVPFSQHQSAHTSASAVREAMLAAAEATYGFALDVLADVAVGPRRD